MNFEIRRISNDIKKVKRQIYCGENYSINTRCNNLVCRREKRAYKNK